MARLRYGRLLRQSQLVGEECERLDAHRGVVWARVDARGLREIPAQITRGRLLVDHGFHAARTGLVRSLRLERVDVDVAVRTALRAETAADAPVFDDDLERIAAADRTHRATDHAQRVA